MRIRSGLIAIGVVGLIGFGAVSPAQASTMPTGPTAATTAADSVAASAALVRSVAVWQADRAGLGPSHASGYRPELGELSGGEATAAVQSLRIGLRYSYAPDGSLSEFYDFHHPDAEITGTAGTFEVVDEATGDAVLSAEAGDVVAVEHDGTNYVLTEPSGDQQVVGGPVRFRAADPENTFAVPSIERRDIIAGSGYVTPEYHGELEVARGEQTPQGMVNVVNVVELESYLRGVVINESPAFFHAESLKSQAVAARGYAVANRDRFVGQGYPFGLDDSALSQVYRGVVAEHPNGNAAVVGTTSLVASYEGEIISAYYSSSMAGHTENFEWSLDGTGDPDEAVPYLTGRYDGPEGTEPDLSTEEGLREFWANDQPQVYDSRASAGNSRNRWEFTLDRELAEDNLEARSDTAHVIEGSDTTIGELASCEATRRSPTGRIFTVRCTGSEAVWEFDGWDDIRRAFPSPTLGVLNNPTFLDHSYDDEGTLESIHVIGGGWGHNVGMSQYGAHGRGLAGQTFGDIITFYYQDTIVGSYPVEVRAGNGAVGQTFSTIDGTGTLQIRDAKKLRGLTVVVNDARTYRFNARQLSKPLVEKDISAALESGENTVRYVPRGHRGSADVLVAVHPSGS